MIAGNRHYYSNQQAVRFQRFFAKYDWNLTACLHLIDKNPAPYRRFFEDFLLKFRT